MHTSVFHCFLCERCLGFGGAYRLRAEKNRQTDGSSDIWSENRSTGGLRKVYVEALPCTLPTRRVASRWTCSAAAAVGAMARLSQVQAAAQQPAPSLFIHSSATVSECEDECKKAITRSLEWGRERSREREAETETERGIPWWRRQLGSSLVVHGCVLCPAARRRVLPSEARSAHSRQTAAPRNP